MKIELKIKVYGNYGSFALSPRKTGNKNNKESVKYILNKKLCNKSN